MARQRYSKKRIDYRNGGRVRMEDGGPQESDGKGLFGFLSGLFGGGRGGGGANTISRKDDSSTRNLPDAPGTVESGDFTYTSENDNRNLLQRTTDRVGDTLGRVADVINPFDGSYPVRDAIKGVSQRFDRQQPMSDYRTFQNTQIAARQAARGESPGQANTFVNTVPVATSSGYNAFTGEVRPSEIPPRPRRSDYLGRQGKANYERALKRWEERYGGGATTTNQTQNTEALLGSGAGGSAMGDNTSTVGMDDPAAGQLVTDLGKTPTPTTATVDKLGTGAITEASTDAEKLAAGISTDVQSIDKDTLTDATAGTATANTATATAGTAGTADTPTDYDAATYTATTAGTTDPTIAAQGTVSKTAEAEGPEFTDANKVQTATRDASAEEQAMAQKQDFTISDDAFVDQVTGKVAEVVDTDPAEQQQRQVQLGMPAPDGEAAQIINKYGFGNSKRPRRLVRGAKAKQEAAANLAANYDLDSEVANQIMEDVEGFRVEDQTQESLGAVAALPKEALVSTQIENLVSGMEDGKPPSWARPAVAAVEQMMAARGLSASTVGRDALFNSIIQSAIPIAQANATALQQRASQNLSNEQQALMQDRQIAASFLEKNAAFKQQMELANLSNDQQMRLANLTSRNQNESENLNAAQQTEMANLNARLQTNLTSAKIAATMNQAQLNVDQQRAVSNAMMVAKVDMAKFSADQQVELANSKFMQSATLTDYNARQQSAMQNATVMAQMDLMAADQRTKLAITNASNFLKMDLANLNSRQQAVVLDQQLKQQRLLSDQAASNAAKQFNATSENQTNQFLTNLEAQMNQFNTSQTNAMEQFNKAEANRISALNAQNATEVSKLNAQLATDVSKFNAQQDFQAEMWNKQNAQAVEQSNINWRRKSNTIDTAAQNAANMMNAQQSFAMDSAEQNFLWQQARDKATYLRQAYENSEQRKTTLYATALASEGGFEGKGPGPESLIDLISGIYVPKTDDED